MAIFKGADGQLRELALFAGAGGGILGGKLLGWRTVCAVEWDAYAATVLVARQNDKILQPFPIWDDVQTFDGRPWRGRVDVVSGGFPCQDISAAGKGAGIDGERSGMWSHMARIVGEVLPRFVYVENSPMLVGRGLVRVIGDLTALGYDCKWGVLGADDVGAPHERKRLWLVAYAMRNGCKSEDGRQSVHDELGECASSQSERHEQQSRFDRNSQVQDALAYAAGDGLERVKRTELKGAGNGFAYSGQAWWRSDPADDPKSGVGRMADGVPNRVDRLKAIGNGQVPLVAATAWQILTESYQGADHD